MTVLVRVDASIQIGTGHVVRMLALAHVLARKRCRVIFLCREFTGNLIELIKTRGFEVFVLPAASENERPGKGYESWLSEPWQTDARQTIEVIKKIGVVSWLIVDHYGIEALWHKELNAHVKKIFVIDDLLNKECDCDLYLNYSVIDDRFAPHGYAGKSLVGLNYALVREEFLKARPQAPKKITEIKNVMVFLGGTDPNNVFPVVFDAVKEFSQIHFHFIVGAGGANKEALLKKITQHENMTCHENVTDMPGLMQKMDFYIGAGGTITWERLVMGLTGLVIAVADNQIPASEALAKLNAHNYLGSYREVTSTLLVHELKELLGDPERLNRMAQASFKLVDGLGLSRVVAAMQTGIITMRKANMGDCVQIFDWRNDPRIRAQALNDEVLDFRTHKAWFENVLKDAARQIYMALINEVPLGVVRFEKKPDGVLISIYLVPNGIGSGWGQSLLNSGISQYCRDFKDVKLFYAQIKEDNLRSQKIFIANGFYKNDHRYVKDVP